MKKCVLFVFLCWNYSMVFAQDVHFSQFFMVPQYINPALTGTTVYDWRIMSNFRQQWGNANTPFTSGMAAGEYKILGRSNNNDEEYYSNVLAVGAAFMYDQSMFGAFKSNYVMATMGYHARLSDYHSIGLGVQGLYGNRRIDYSRLTFGEQFSSGGFDVTLPSGETALSSLKPYFSLNAGLLFNYSRENFNLDLGGSIYHLNKPRQSFLKDENQILPMRYVLHANAEYGLSDYVTAHINGIYMEQELPAYFSLGGALGFDISNGNKSHILYGGAWFREGDSFYPYMGMKVNNLQIGFSYDVTHSQQNLGPSIPRTMEVSLVITNNLEKKGQIGCPFSPWK